MEKPTEIEPGFNKAAGALPKTNFANYLKEKFDDKTAQRVLKTFQEMGLPIPERKREFMQGTEGASVFLNKYGVVIRIESKTSKNSDPDWAFDRINNSPWILSPIASIDAGEAIIEVCPGCQFEKDAASNDYLYRLLRSQQIDFWDRDTYNNNTGRIPVKTIKFPEGIPVVIDRLAVRNLTESIESVRLALKDDIAREAAETQESLYAPLCGAFNEAWPDAVKMRQFWELCQRYVEEGKLVAGWNEGLKGFSNISKTKYAADTAEIYGRRLETAADKPVSSAAPAAPRSPRQPV